MNADRFMNQPLRRAVLALLLAVAGVGAIIAGLWAVVGGYLGRSYHRGHAESQPKSAEYA